MSERAAGDGAVKASPYGVRLHGRGGQGVVTAAELLSVAAFLDGHEAQAFPSFGSERMGAPVVSFCRIAESPIRVREPVADPHCVLICDATLLHHVDLFAGLAADGIVLINSARTVDELGLGDLVERLPANHVLCVPATELAREHVGRPMPNVCMLGAFAAATNKVSRLSLDEAVRERFPAAIAAANIKAADAAYTVVKDLCHA